MWATSRSRLPRDLYEANPRTGRVVLEYGGRIAGGGLVLSLRGEAKKADAPAVEALAARAAALGRTLSGLDLTGRLSAFRREVEGPIVFTTSFGLEDQVILHHICEAGLDIDLVTLDTGRLFAETYTKSREARGACCDIRKVEPLNRVRAGAVGWITGLRADQSAHREAIGLLAADPGRGLLKLSPLHDWTRDAVRTFAGAHAVPANPLHVARLRLDRLRPLHPRHPPRRAGTRRPLVVGRRKQEGVRLAHRAGGGEPRLWPTIPDSSTLMARERARVSCVAGTSTWCVASAQNRDAV
jgi:phosphoadenosine phosphosulfate reductase